MKITFVYPNLHGEFRPNIGLALLMTYIAERTRHEADLIDVTFYRRNWRKYVRKKLRQFTPDVIGVSALTFNFYDSVQILHYIKKLCPNTFVVYGGVHPSLAPLETLKIKYIDAVVVGDGEYTLEKLLDALEEGRSFDDIPGIYYKKDGKIIHTGKSEFIRDLDALPFVDWSYWEVEKYEVVNPYEIDILGSRGCPFNCSYCLNTVLRNVCKGRYVRFRSPENIVREMIYQLKRFRNPKYRYFYFWDDMFNLHRNFVMKFCDLLIKKGLPDKITWSCSSRVDTVREDVMKKMAEANLNLTRLGIEAGSYRIRKEVYFKNFTTKQIIDAMNLCKKYNIKTQCDFIVGGPKETPETIKKTIALMVTIDPTQVSINVFQPFPMIKASEILVEDGGKIESEGWRNLTNIFLKTPMKHNRIKKWQLYYLTFKMNSIYIVRTFFKYLFREKIRFIFDILAFLLYWKWKYNFLWHDLFKFTVRKYIFEENLGFKKLFVKSLIGYRRRKR